MSELGRKVTDANELFAREHWQILEEAMEMWYERGAKRLPEPKRTQFIGTMCRIMCMRGELQAEVQADGSIGYRRTTGNERGSCRSR